MTSISGTAEFGDAYKRDAELNRQLGLARPRVVKRLMSLFTVGAGVVIGCFVWRHDPGLGAIVGAVISLTLWSYLDGMWDAAAHKKQLALRGGYETVRRLTVSVTPDGIGYEDIVCANLVKWPYISELLCIEDCWIFVAELEAFCYLPRHFFQSKEAERMFIDEVLGYMTEPARARSKDAAQFASGG